MQTLFKKPSLALLSTLLISLSSYAAVPDISNPVTFLGPTGHFGFTTNMSNNSAVSLALEAAPKNYRFGTTFGWVLTPEQRVKISGEYLWQNINYSFFSGDAEAWVQQIAFGVAYEHDFFEYGLAPRIGLSGYFSHAPSRSIGTVTGLYINSAGIPFFFSDYRRIAGGNAFGFVPEFSIEPWMGARLALEINYDDVFYSEHNDDTDPNHDASGLGGTLRLKQALLHNLDLELAAGKRKPYDEYSAKLNWSHLPFHGDWTLGLFGDYINGKNSLPTTWNVGISADYFLDRRVVATPDFKGERGIRPSDNLLSWTADPAVYMPQVLAVADPKLQLNCTQGVIVFSGPIISLASNSGSFNVTPNFSGTNLVFSVATVPALSPGDTVTISATGQLTYSFADTPPYNVIVTARNICNTASSNVFRLGTALI